MNQFREPAKMLPKMPINSSAVYAIAPGRFFRSRGPFLFLRSENPGRKRPLVAPATPPLKMRPRGSCGGFLGFPSGHLLLKSPGEKPPKKPPIAPGCPCSVGSVCRFFSPPGCALVGVRFGVRVSPSGFRFIRERTPELRTGPQNKPHIVNNNLLPKKTERTSHGTAGRFGRWVFLGGPAFLGVGPQDRHFIQRRRP